MNKLQKVTDKTNHKKLYTLQWPGIKLITLVVTDTDYTGKCKSNYQTTMITIGPSFSKCLLWYSAYSCKNKMVKFLIKMKHLYLISEVQILSTISINNFTNLNPITYMKGLCRYKHNKKDFLSEKKEECVNRTSMPQLPSTVKSKWRKN
jgi:uncharacterized CHY-type Zn-finger protein